MKAIVWHGVGNISVDDVPDPSIKDPYDALVIGVYPPTMDSFPIGAAMNKNLTIKMGNAEHRRYIPQLLDLVAAGLVDPATVLTQEVPLAWSALEAYETFDQREAGWIKTVLAVDTP